MSINPTIATYQTLQKAYDFFNRELFSGELPACLITMQRHRNAKGYFCAEMFESRGEEDKHRIHEIAMNPTYFYERSDEDILSTLVHEMVHLWQQEKGKPSRGRYHNSEWADKMEDIGLIPSDTEEEGGARTGPRMSHYIDKDGRFKMYIDIFIEQNEKLNYQDRPVPKAKKAKKNKVKYTCPKCLLNAWGKPGIELLCGADRSILVSQESS